MYNEDKLDEAVSWLATLALLAFGALAGYVGANALVVVTDALIGG